MNQVRSRTRRYVEKPDVRTLLLDAAESILIDEGHAAATARRIADKVGLKHQIVFYYFGTQEELLLALFRRGANTHRQKLTAALQSANPLLEMWSVARDPASTRLKLEFLSLASRSEVLRKEVAANTEAVRQLEADTIAHYLAGRQIEPTFSSELVSILTNSVARLLIMEEIIGVTKGHEEADRLIVHWIKQFASTLTPAFSEPVKRRKRKG